MDRDTKVDVALRWVVPTLALVLGVTIIALTAENESATANLWLEGRVGGGVTAIEPYVDWAMITDLTREGAEGDSSLHECFGIGNEHEKVGSILGEMNDHFYAGLNEWMLADFLQVNPDGSYEVKPWYEKFGPAKIDKTYCIERGIEK